ncbi:alpha/beta hydrolase [Spirillospora sp. NPDC048911]|uniref:alpha/beta hydrolase n=1 Tax=Spirillospora sp. NPDC048911 TaxID=3364527 RepID=UPI003722FFC8
MHPNLDPELREALTRSPLARVDYTRLSPDELNDLRELRKKAAAPPLPDVRVEDRVIAGSGIRVRIYRPADAAPDAPCLYWIHGGGMILGSPEGDDARVSRYVAETGAVAVSVDYRLAPRHPHPTPVEDCYAGLVWTWKNAATLGIDASRLAIGGISAGGGLAAGTALLARDRDGPSLIFQLLLCPMLDDRDATPSSAAFAEAITWPRAFNVFGWSSLLGAAAGGPDVPIYAAPARATDLSGLPPAYLDVGELEVFRDECADYALRLVRSGVSVEFHLWPGAFHGFDDAPLPVTGLVQRARAEQVAALLRAFTHRTPA